jgi:hypothetical protein
MKATPEYAAFIAAMDEWKAGREAYAEQRGWKAVQQEWEDALDAQTVAWSALIACPVQTTSQVAEKLTLARKVFIGDDEASQLLDSVSTDLTLITTH